MERDSSFDIERQMMLWCDMIENLAFDQLGPKDKVLIKTKNSLYRFSVSDPAQRLGILSGGTLGDGMHRAVLIESLIDDANAARSNPKGLKIGARALFFIDSPYGVERVITSAITNLTLVKSNGELLLVS